MVYRKWCQSGPLRYTLVAWRSGPNALVPTVGALTSLSRFHLWLHWKFPKNIWKRKRSLEPGNTGNWTCSPTIPSWGIPNGHMWRESLLVDGNIEWTLLVTFLRRRNGQMCDYIQIHGLWPVVWHGQRSGRKMIGKLVIREFREEVCR